MYKSKWLTHCGSIMHCNDEREVFVDDVKKAQQCVQITT